MKVILALLVLLALATQAYAGILYERTVVPTGWVKSVPSPANAVVSFIIALKQRNLDKLDAKFWTVSNPEHADYQNYMSSAEIQAMVAPEPAVIASIQAWLMSHGVHSSSMKDYGDAIEVRTTVSRASALFDTTFFMFKHENTGKIINMAWGAYSVPDFVHANIEFVEGLSTFTMPRVSSPKQFIARPDYIVQIAVPQFVQQLYSVPSVGTLANPTNSHGVIEFGGESFTNNDTVMFNRDSRWNSPLIADAQIIGPNNASFPGAEGTLDVQWQAAMNPSATPWFWTEDDPIWLYGWTVHFLNSSKVPMVVSISYGWWEAEQCVVTSECHTLGVTNEQYVARVNVQFQKIGITGVTLLVASGDSGANSRSDLFCRFQQLRPPFPASSPYVTAVGGTEIQNPVFNMHDAPPICSDPSFTCVSGGYEVAVSRNVSGFASGGGFSNLTMMPAYQSSAVQAYLSSGVKLPPASYFNAAGRAIPDVAALGSFVYYHVYIAGAGVGTSVSSPLFSGVMSMLNFEAIKISGKPLGFLNPLLYSMAGTAAFQDITEGDNICTEVGCLPTCKGFYATKGWDPVTGLGTPNYAAMLQNLQSMFARRKIVSL